MEGEGRRLNWLRVDGAGRWRTRDGKNDKGILMNEKMGLV